MTISQTSERLLTILKPSNGHYYHRKQSFDFLEGESRYIPVNRNYVECTNGDRVCKGKTYNKSPVISEEVKTDQSLYDHERIFTIHTANFLYLDDPDYRRFDPLEWDDDHTSLPTAHILQRLNIPNVGVFGSHRLGLIGAKSDIDLIAYAGRNRHNLLSYVTEQLQHQGLREIKGDAKEMQYAQKYADRHNIPLEAGLYLAQKRHRFTTPEGLPVSFQMMPETYDTKYWNLFFDSQTLATYPVEREVEIISGESYGLPKTWEVCDRGQTIPVLGLRWNQQGMGEETDCVIKGTQVETDRGNFLYLRDPDSYLLPQRIL